mgnify:CR=1 FL=1
MTAEFECLTNTRPLVPTLPRGNAYAEPDVAYTEPDVPTLGRGNEKWQALVIDVVLRSSY